MRRYLVVANKTLGGEHLMNMLRECVAAGPCSFHVVVPASAPPDHWTHTESQARAVAQRRLDEAMARFAALGAEVDGEVGDSRPMEAIGDALRAGTYDEIILSTLPPGPSRWLHQDLPHRVVRTFGLPLIHVVAVQEPAPAR